MPCAECNACCRTFHVIHVRPEEKSALSRIPRRALLPAPGLPPGNLVIGHDQAGCCPLLVDGRCTIYPDRPLACRTFDCRIYAATGVRVDRDEIASQVERWTFSYSSQEDGDLRAAVQAATRYIREHPECFANDIARRDPLRVAVLAIAVHELFLESGPDTRGPAPPESAVARAVVAADAKLFGDL